MSGAMEVSQNSILRMSDEKTMQLIELYEKEECLWNTQLDDYKNREKRAKATEKIAEILNVPHFEPRHVVIKFKNLRNSYCQELKKIAHSMNSGLGPEDIYRPKVFWFTKMDSFLKPHLQPARNTVPCYLLATDVQMKKEPVEEYEENWVQMTNPDDVLIPESSFDHSENSATGSEDWCTKEICKSSKKANLSSGRKRSAKTVKISSKRPKVDEDPLADGQVLQSLNEISTQLNLLTTQNVDYYDNFGKYIASLLRSLPQRKAYQLQPKIVSLITNEAFPPETGRVSQSDENETT